MLLLQIFFPRTQLSKYGQKGKAMEWTIEKTAIGEEKVKTQKNGVGVRLLQKPSKEYAAKMKKKAEAEKARQAEEDIKATEEKKISDEIRQMAIERLQQRGEL